MKIVYVLMIILIAIINPSYANNLIKEIKVFPEVVISQSNIAINRLPPEYILKTFSESRFYHLIGDKNKATSKLDLISKMLNSIDRNHSITANHIESISALYQIDNKKFNIIIPINGLMRDVRVISYSTDLTNPPKLTSLSHVMINLNYPTKLLLKDIEKLKNFIINNNNDAAFKLYKHLEERDVKYYFTTVTYHENSLNNLRLAKMLLENGHKEESRHALKQFRDNLLKFSKNIVNRSSKTEKIDNMIKRSDEFITILSEHKPADLTYQIAIVKTLDDWFDIVKKW